MRSASAPQLAQGHFFVGTDPTPASDIHIVTNKSERIL